MEQLCYKLMIEDVSETPPIAQQGLRRTQGTQVGSPGVDRAYQLPHLPTSTPPPPHSLQLGSDMSYSHSFEPRPKSSSVYVAFMGKNRELNELHEITLTSGFERDLMDGL